MRSHFLLALHLVGEDGSIGTTTLPPIHARGPFRFVFQGAFASELSEL
jgi:hypothetical protein